MARKNMSRTYEEKIEESLVPDWEQPYKVPSNWIWTRLGKVCTFERGITFPASAKEFIPSNEVIPCIRTANVQENLEIEDLIYVNKSYMKGNEAKLVKQNDIIMSSANSRELVGKTCFVKHVLDPMTFGGFVLNIRAKNIHSKFLFYMLRFEFLSGNFMGESTQTTNIANINTTKLSNYSFPLPPLEEQQRIVERIESLFSKLDEAKEKAQMALDSFECRKVAILHKAFTGELSKKWREENGVGINNWEEKTLASVCYSIFDGDHMPPPKSESGVPFLVISNVNKGKLSFENTRFVPQEYYDRLTETRKPMWNDILYTIVGTIGIPVLVNSYREFCFQRHMALFKPRNINSKLLWYLLQSEDAFQKSNNIATGTAQRTVPIKRLRELSFVIPMLPSEQNEIVRILDSIFDKEQRAKELVSVIEKINLIKKAILARAFRGDLDTNKSEEESALELLKEILSAN